MFEGIGKVVGQINTSRKIAAAQQFEDMKKHNADIMKKNKELPRKYMREKVKSMADKQFTRSGGTRIDGTFLPRLNGFGPGHYEKPGKYYHNSVTGDWVHEDDYKRDNPSIHTPAIIFK
jgi:hypothetical protein